jgi:N-acyl-D-aspartate/D-glutamate deacylase
MSEGYDVLVKDTTIIDGTGAVGFRGSLGIKGEKIAAVGQLTGSADRIIDGSSLVTCPGFVDMHSHADMSLLRFPLAENLVMQGITTFVGGNCGFSLAPFQDRDHFERMAKTWNLDLQDASSPLNWKTFGQWLGQVEETGTTPNYVPLVGHNTIREAVIGERFQRKATPDEIAEMKALVAEAMRSGAFGLSVGLDAYWAGHFADVDQEIVELVKVAESYGAFFTPHTRHHQNQWPAEDPSEYGYGLFHAPAGEIIAGRYHGLLEAVEISRKANNVKLHIAHFTPVYLIPQPHPDFLDKAVARASLEVIVDQARDEGLDVTFNALGWTQSIGSQVPVIDSFFAERLLLPDWLLQLGPSGFIDNLGSTAFRDRVKEMVYSGKFKFGMLHPLTDPYWMDCYQVLQCTNKACEGQTIGQIARERERGSIIKAVYDESLEVVFDLLLEDPGTTWALIIDKREYGALATFFAHPVGVPCTDVQALPGKPIESTTTYGRGIPPIAYGMFPHYFREYVKDKSALRLEEAVRKVTSFAAQEVLGIKDRGVLREGAYADIVVLDFDRLSEGGDFAAPATPPGGIEHVLVNGTIVYEKAQHTGSRPGKVLRR